ncbi:MinD/ParA family ATP-binding protein [Mycobacterium neglectum]|uniref:MinD/ParA family ATP-binding protein n=1 Tax=Mycobacterium neglectum TaxID=242737 RepID=UPI001FEAE7F0|nr:MinD/ParA family protein [Mycobacterium neglectum]
MSDQDFFSQYLQPTGTPAGEDAATPTSPDDIAREDGEAHTNSRMPVPQADPHDGSATPPPPSYTTGPAAEGGFDSGQAPPSAYPTPPPASTPPWAAEGGFDGGQAPPSAYPTPPPASTPPWAAEGGFDSGQAPPSAYPTPPPASTPPWAAEGGFDSGQAPPSAYPTPPPASTPPWAAEGGFDGGQAPPSAYPTPPPMGEPPTAGRPGGESTPRHAQPPAGGDGPVGDPDGYYAAQSGYAAPAPRRAPVPPPPPRQYDPRGPVPRPDPVERRDWQSGPAAAYPAASPQPQQQPAPPPPRPPEPGPIGWPAQRHESVGAMQSQVREADFVTPYKQVPERGWRRRVYKTTRINLGLSPAEREWNDLRRRLTVNLRGTYTIAVLQQKGGVSKTTTAVGIGAALARYRDDKVVAIDANPASGNLAKRVNEPSTGTWRGLLADANLHSYSDFRHYLGKDGSSGLEVLAGDPGDKVITGKELVMTWQRLSRQYPIALLDCGNQMRDDVIAAVLSMADAVVVPTTTRYDGAEAARETLDWLMQHGYPHLVRSAVMVVSNVNKVTPTKAVRNLHEGFERAVRAVHDIPYDPHLSDATAISFDRLAPQTQRAFIETAASLVDGFAGAADKDPGYRPQWPTPGDDDGQGRR